MNDQDILIKLLHKYLNRSATAQETQELFLLIQDIENEEVLQALLEDNMGQEDTPSQPGDAKAIRAVRVALLREISKEGRSMDQQQTGIRRLRLPGWLSVSAIFLLAGAATCYLYFTRFIGPDPRHQQDLITQITITRRTERKVVRLFDGSKVWLSPSTTIRYADQLIAGKRQLYLDGEAFFEVAKDKHHPFIIHSGRMQTEVVGTSFDIKSYSERNEYSVRVVTGKVKVALLSTTSEKLKEVILIPKQEAVLDKQHGELRQATFQSVQPIVNIRYGLLTYNGAPVAEVIADLRRAYAVEIVGNNASVSCQFYGVLDTRKPVSIALQQLTTAINARLKTDGDQYTIEGGCEE